MAGSVGSAYIEVLPSLKGFQAKVKADLDGMDLSAVVSLTPKLDAARAVAEAEAAGAEAGDAYGGKFGDMVRARLEAAMKALPEAKLNADSSEAEQRIAVLRAELADLSSRRIGLDISPEEALAAIAEVRANLAALQNSDSIQVRADTAAALAELEAVQADVDKLDGKTAKVDVKVDDHGSAAAADSNLGHILWTVTKWTGLIPIVSSLGAAVAGLGAAAAVGAAGVGAVVLGFLGVPTAVKAMGDAEQSAAQDAQQAADAITSAKEREASAEQSLQQAQASAADAAARAAEQVSNAEHNLEAAQQGALQAQQALNDAREQAARAMEDLNMQVEDGALAQKQASLDVQKAKQELDTTLANPGATDLQRQQAQLTYDEAVQHLSDLQLKNQQLAEDKAKSDAAGVDGSKQVVAAQQGVQSATDKVASAQQALGDAVRAQAAQQRDAAYQLANSQQQVADAQRALAKALQDTGGQGSAAMKKVQQAMADLTPTGQAFAQFLFGLKGQFDAIKAAAQNGFLPGLQGGIQALLPVMPQIVTVVGELAKAMGGLFQAAGQALASPFWASFFQTVGQAATTLMPQFGSMLNTVAQLLGSLVEAFLPIAPIAMQVISTLASALQPLVPYIGQIAQILLGGLLSAFQALEPAIVPLGQALAALAGPAAAVLSVLGQALSSAIQALAPVIVALAPPLTTLINLVGNFLVGAIQAIAPILPPLAAAFGQIAQILLGGLLQAVQMVMPYLGQIIQVLGGLFVNALNALMPLFPSLVDAFLKIVQAVLPIIPPLLSIVQALIPPLIGLIPILVPLIVKIADSFAEIIPQLVPVVTTLAEALIPIINALMPIVTTVFTAFVDIVSWAMSTIVVPLLQDIVIPAIQAVADMVNWLSDHVVTPVFQWIGGVIKGAWDNVISPVFEAIKTGIGKVGDFIKTTVDDIGSIWDDLKKAFGTPIEFVIRTILNGGLLAGINWILDKVGLSIPLIPDPNLPTFAEGGVLPGYSPGNDTVHALLSPGEGVLVPQAVRGLGGEAGIDAINSAFGGGGGPTLGAGGLPGFDLGGLVSGVIGAVGDAASAVTSAVSSAVTSAKNAVLGGLRAAAQAFFDDVVKPLIGAIPGADDNFAKQMLTGLANKIENGLLDFLGGKDQAAIAAGGTIPTGSQLSIIDSALQADGVDKSLWPVWEAGLNTLIQRESSWNPNAVNNTDSNAARGTPSEGLAQVILPTFNTYKNPALADNLLDPVANVAAAINYINARYGGIGNVQQANPNLPPKGYALGGVVPDSYVFDTGGTLLPGWNTVYNGLGRPEPLVPADRAPAGLDGLTGLSITGALTVDGMDARIDGRITAASHATGTAIATGRRV